MNTKVFNILKWIVIGFFAFFIIVQVYSGFIDPVTTDTVYPFSSYTGFDTAGFIIRNETLIEQEINGILSYEVSNGGRVAKGGTIATVYSSSADADNFIRIAELEKRIDTLSKIQTYNDFNAADITGVNRNIHEALSEVIGATQNGSVESTEYLNILLENMARKQIITGQATDFNGLISSLKAERDSLKSSAGQTGGKVVSPLSGYVIYSADGYENAVSTEDIESVTAETLKAVTKTAAVNNAVCKIVSDYEWYIAASVPFSEALKIKQGDKVTLRTSLQSVPELDVTVKCVNKQSAGDDAVVVFACDTMNNELAQLRNIDITIVYQEYKGLKVDNRAIRVTDGQKGVYVLLASQVKFIPIEVLWTGGNYSIVKQEPSEKRVLRIYDEIIVKGKNLYDGKIIN